VKRTPIRRVSKRRAAQKRQEDILRQKLLIRCKGLCESCNEYPDWLGLSLSHTEPKGMGGTRREYTEDDVQLLCNNCHNKKHGITVKTDKPQWAYVENRNNR
jgi:5-methylcytosine-specific restriction endonuclease McrA